MVSLHAAGLIALTILSIISIAGAIHCAIVWAWLPAEPEEECEP